MIKASIDLEKPKGTIESEGNLGILMSEIVAITLLSVRQVVNEANRQNGSNIQYEDVVNDVIKVLQSEESRKLINDTLDIEKYID